MNRLPLVSPLDRILFLKAQPYLLGQPPEVLTALASYSEEVFHPRGTRIRDAGGRVDHILFLAQGRVDIIEGGDARAPARSVTAPGVVGLAHHFAGTESAPEVRAARDTLCLEIAVQDLDPILEDHFTLCLGFAQRGGAEVLARSRASAERPDEAGFAAPDHRATPVVLDPVQKLAQARRSPFFRGANLTVLGQLVRFQDPERIAVGDRLWRIGDPIERMALVLDGRFHTEGPFAIGRAASGAVIGAWEILEEGLHEESWVAEAAGRILWIDRHAFVDLLEDHWEFAEAYLRHSSCRLVSSWEAEESLPLRS